MSASTKALLNDNTGRPVPQIYDPTTDSYVALSYGQELAQIAAVGATTTQTTPDLTNLVGRGVKAVLDVTAIGTGSITLTLQGKDLASGKYYTLLSGAAVITNGTNVYELYPGIASVTNVAANTALPRTWRVVVTANNANAASYTVGTSVLV